MAQTDAKETKTIAQTDEERVEVFVPRGNKNDDPNQFISVNGKNYLLPKGKASLVPKCVAEEFERSQRAQARFDETVDRLSAK